jgi:hypothetical protein
MAELICTRHKHKSSNPGYLYLPKEWLRGVFEIPWGKRHRIECNSLTCIHLSDKDLLLGGIIYYRDLPESSFLIWKACEGHMYSLSHIGQYISSPDGVWTDRYNKPVIATPTTLEEIDVYRTFL